MIKMVCRSLLCTLLLISQPAASIDDFSIHCVAEKMIHFAMGAAMGSLSVAAHVGQGVSYVIPALAPFRQELGFLSQISGSATRDIFAQFFKPSTSAYQHGIKVSEQSWYHNHSKLSLIPTATQEERQLIEFLDNRWLAKSTGFFSFVINWVYPCFGVSIQVHPETTSHYARDPRNKFSTIYAKKVSAWKQELPHPAHFPLLLTRPFSLKDHLPAYQVVHDASDAVSIAKQLQKAHSKIVVDVTDVDGIKFQDQFVTCCHSLGVKKNKAIFVQRTSQNEVGGLRILPFPMSSHSKIERDHRYLLKWISLLGLTASRLELDRCNSSFIPTVERTYPVELSCSKEELISFCKAMDHKSDCMLKGTLQIIVGLLEKWKESDQSNVRSTLVEEAMIGIHNKLKKIDGSFYDRAFDLEEIHAHLSTLIEVLSPYQMDEFHPIYQNALACIPSPLKPLTTCSIHSSGMTSMSGIFAAVQKQTPTPHVLYGENCYFECIFASEGITKSRAIEQASENDFKQVDLLLAQFNPALKRIDMKPTEYRVERVAETVRKIFEARSNKPLTVALDCTLDYLNSSKLQSFLEEFAPEISSGLLNVICYRSGLKFDLFGMDNYYGAPFFMIHNHDPAWAPFNNLITDPVLLTDKLSLNWFCLAFQHASQELDAYRKHIFDNTRAFLNRIPPRLFEPTSRYRVVSMEESADVAFVDIKVSGPYHPFKCASLIGGCLNLKCLQNGHPIFHRPSIGFYHPNFTMLFSKDNSTIRLTFGLDPTQVDVLTECFAMIDTLNGTYD